MTQTLVALYNDMDTAKTVIQQLVNGGFARENISVVANDATGQYSGYLAQGVEVHSSEDVQAGEGAGFGAIVGALVGLGAMIIPGLGPVIAAGPIAAALVGLGVGAATGALTGGIVAGLVDLGVTSEDAPYYAEGVRRGGTLVIVHSGDDWVERVRQTLNAYNPVDVQTRAGEWRETGWTGFDAASVPYTAEQTQLERERYNTPR